MDNQEVLKENLHNIISRYQSSFNQKVYSDENDEDDVLMNLFSITPQIKRENRQYWGRELGMRWQLLVIEICRHLCNNYQPALRFDKDEPCDLVVGNYAIDTKYRMGSGDSGTLKKFKFYGNLLKEHEYEPILLILRTDNLAAAIKACEIGGWTIYTGDSTLEFIQTITKFDIKQFLESRKEAYTIFRN